MRNLILGTLSVMLLGLGSAQAQDKDLSKALDISMSGSLLDSKKGVLQVKNISGDEIKGIVVEVMNKETNRKGTYTIKSIKNSKKTEVGKLEIGSLFVAGDEITLTLEGYAPLKFITGTAASGGVSLKKVEAEKK